MRIRMNGQVIQRRAVWWDNGQVKMIDQRLLPFVYSEVSFSTPEEVGIAIRDMVVRGAPSIGVAAAYGLALGLQSTDQISTESELVAFIERTSVMLNTRPTAKDLTTALDVVGRMVLNVFRDKGMEEVAHVALEAAQRFDDETVDACKLIGKHGDSLIHDGARILTHCNAGALATQDIGTALAPIRKARDKGKGVFVYVDETRPRNQGSRLTAWELENEDICHRIIADSASGHYMSKGDVDMVIVGADRVAVNGDTANKIGTYALAVLARENGIAFYVAMPWSTFDPSITAGHEIAIEERDPQEVLSIAVETGRFDLKGGFSRCANPGSRGLNPAFDITPARFITGFITPDGVFKSEELATAFNASPRGILQ